MNFPSWQDVGVPKILVNNVQQMRHCALFDQLVNQIIFHHNKRIVATYNCNTCGNGYTPDRPTEQISYCQTHSCHSPLIRLTQRWHDNERVPVGRFTLDQLLITMEECYQKYFKNKPEDMFSWGYERERYWVEFAGGNRAWGTSPKLTAYKAAILVPFMWDMNFLWSENFVADGFICNTINGWTVKE